MTSEPIVSRCGSPLLSLCSAECDIDDALVESAKHEVTARRLEFKPLGVSWGYLLGIEREQTKTGFPAAWKLWDVLRRDIATPIERQADTNFRASFCKAYAGPVVKEAEGVHFEGLHIDTHPELRDGADLLRILINVGDTDRRFRFGDATRVELHRAGLYPDRTDFRAADVESRVKMHEVRIPRRQGRVVSFLVFWASVLPHVGLTESPGYFLYSFESVTKSPTM